MSVVKEAALAVCTLAVHFFVAIVVCAFMVLVVPRYKVFFDRFGAELSAAAVSAIQLSDFFVSYWYLLLFAMASVGGAISFGLRALPNGLRWVQSCWLITWPVAAIVFLFFESLVLSIMVEKLTNDLS